jgi:Transglycosylase associated protein.
MIWSWIVKIALWALAGFAASRIMHGKPDSLLSNVLLGMVGGVVGSLLFGLIGLGSINGIGNILISVVGACLVLFLVKKFAK